MKQLRGAAVNLQLNCFRDASWRSERRESGKELEWKVHLYQVIFPGSSRWTILQETFNYREQLENC